MPQTILLDIAVVVLLAVGAHWLAWRLRLPSILLLLLAGIVVGPVLELVDGQVLNTNWFFTVVSLTLGLLLFERGRNLRLSVLRKETGAQVVLSLVTVGALVTIALAAMGAFFFLGVPPEIALLVGVLLTMTGAPVVDALLRHVRPEKRISHVVRWEGGVLDVVGALTAVLSLNALLLLNEPSGAETGVVEHVVTGLGLGLFVALGVSVTAAMGLLFLLRRDLVSDSLRDAVTLAVVVLAFALSNVLQPGSGLLTAALLGLAVANQSFVDVRQVGKLRGALRTLLVGVLFLLLGARLEGSALIHFDTSVLLFVGFLILLVRPLAVRVAALGTSLQWEEKAFLAWTAPRGAVMAGLTVLVVYRLRPDYPEALDGLVPILFAVVLSTVAVYGLSLGPLAQWLGLADRHPNGILFAGAGGWVRSVACAVQDLGVPVLLVDKNSDRVQRARERGLSAERVDALSETVFETVDFSGIGRILVTLPNEDVGRRVAQHFTGLFNPERIYRLRGPSGDGPDRAVSDPGSIGLLFGEGVDYASVQTLVEKGGEVKRLRRSDDGLNAKQNESEREDADESVAPQGDGRTFIPLFVWSRDGRLDIVSGTDPIRIGSDDQLIAVVAPDWNGQVPRVGDTDREVLLEEA